MFEEQYWAESNYPKQILKGRKPLHNRFWIRKLKKIKHSGRLLELGCGEGFFLEYAEKFYATSGIDISEFAIKNAKYRCKKSNLQVLDLAALLSIKQGFDIIVCFDVLEHLAEPREIIAKCSALLKDKGFLLISVPNINSIGKLWKGKKWFGYRDETHISLLPKSEWTKSLKDSGFKIIDTSYDGLWDSPYFSRIPSFLQHCLFKFPATFFFYLGIRFPERYGEVLYILAINQKSSTG